MDSIGDNFHQQTKYDPSPMPRGRLDWAAQPALYKEYPDLPTIELQAVATETLMSLDQTLKTRKSVRDFRPKPIGKGQLAYLLWAATGIQRIEHGYEFRTAPSAGALYPIETYLTVNRVAGVENGLYHYAVRKHQLEQLKLGNYGSAVAKAALGQSMCGQATVVFIWSAVFQRCKWKYGQRAFRYIYLDAGHIAENLALAAVGLNLGSCEIGAFYDDRVNAVLGLDGIEEGVVCMAAVGHPE